MKFCNYKFSVTLIASLVLGSTVFFSSGCSLSMAEKPVQNIPIGTIGCQSISDGIVSLIKNVRTADEGTISLKNISNEATVLTIERQVAAGLKASGYAVQELLPSYERQKGDLKEVKATGSVTTINVQQLEGTNQYQLSLILGREAYYRLLSLQGRQLVPVSNWVRHQNF